jgi:hypothetical protein
MRAAFPSGECVTTTKLTGPVLPGMSVPAAELFPRATMEDQHLLSDQRGRTRTRVVALGLAAVACGLVAAVAVTGSKAVSLMQYQIVNIPRRWLPPPLPPPPPVPRSAVDEVCAAPIA